MTAGRTVLGGDLGVNDSPSSRHPMYIACARCHFASHEILMRKLSVNHIQEHFMTAMRMLRKQQRWPYCNIAQGEEWIKDRVLRTVKAASSYIAPLSYRLHRRFTSVAGNKGRGGDLFVGDIMRAQGSSGGRHVCGLILSDLLQSLFIESRDLISDSDWTDPNGHLDHGSSKGRKTGCCNYFGCVNKYLLCRQA